MGQNKNILPQGWKTKPINQVFEFIGTSSFSRNDINYEIDDNSIYYIHYGDIHATYKNAVLDFETENRIPVLKKHIKPSANFLKEGDLIIADASEDYEGVGEALEVFNIKDKKAIAGLHTFALRDKNNDTAHGYRAYLFKNPGVKKSLKTIATGSKVYGISKGNLEKFKIILPPLPEQQKIAKILFTWDKAIKLQQQLIDNKKQYKKAVMKKLLTGEVRFKGFSERWKHVKLGSIIDIGSSKRVLEKDWISKGIPFYRTREIISLTKKEEFRTPIYISEKLFDEIKKRYGVPKSDDILVTGVGTIGEMYIVKKNDEFYFKDGNVIWFKMNNKLNSEFLFQQFQIRFIKKQLSDNASITTVSTFTIDGAKKINIKYPCIEEQQKIASFLSKIDYEIKALEKELISFQKQKQGLIQQLLTGKVRVKN